MLQQMPTSMILCHPSLVVYDMSHPRHLELELSQIPLPPSRTEIRFSLDDVAQLFAIAYLDLLLS